MLWLARANIDQNFGYMPKAEISIQGPLGIYFCFLFCVVMYIPTVKTNNLPPAALTYNSWIQ